MHLHGHRSTSTQTNFVLPDCCLITVLSHVAVPNANVMSDTSHSADQVTPSMNRFLEAQSASQLPDTASKTWIWAEQASLADMSIL